MSCIAPYKTGERQKQKDQLKQGTEGLKTPEWSPKCLQGSLSPQLCSIKTVSMDT